MEERNDQTLQETPEGYTERPAWQVWAARAGLVIFLAFVILQIIQIAGGGLS